MRIISRLRDRDRIKSRSKDAIATRGSRIAGSVTVTSESVTATGDRDAYHADRIADRGS
ncbi:hypothetical protein HPP92_003671 [Vanilla planifolia]|uniref:Uncharacterized protein n=1 Tax=Vanilla planifolia TaxID=51239 RepID=A0A835RUV7_VANPL|nr:hypothetical protein HPP92_003671 [Vanilla planifolia]